jgi:phage shock protein PspC (stress-responsive transcriptional regulator)
MEKVINITIGGMVFYVEVDAYEQLSNYLNSIKKHFSKDKDCDEIVTDIESSIAEKFMARKKKDSAISSSDVAKVIEQMGTLKDFKFETEEDFEEDEEKPANRKLYRDPDDTIIAGVCSGLGAYFGIDTVIVRLIFVISLFFGGLGLAVYIVLWIIAPIAETTAQKLEMRGERITLHEIEKSVKKEITRLKKKDFSLNTSKFKNFLDQLFKIIGQIVWALLKALRGILGLAFLIAGIAGMFFLSFGLTWQVSGATFPHTTIALNDFVALSGTPYLVFAFAIYIVALIPLILIFLLGYSLLKKRGIINPLVLVALLVVWFSAMGFTGSIIFDNQEKIEQKIFELDQQINNYQPTL